MVRQRATIGDLVVIPVGDGRSHIAQSVGAWLATSHYYAVFNLVVADDEALGRAQEATLSGIKLVGLAGTERVRRGQWPIVGTAPVSSDVPLPAYKEGRIRTDGTYAVSVVDYSGERKRPANRDEAIVLDNHTVMQPGYLEWVLRASLGLEVWIPSFDDLLPANIIRSSDMFPD